MSEKKIEVGQIWEVISDDFLTSGRDDHYKRPTKLNKGEMIEIRYPFEWHFRTFDNHYFHATSEMIYQNCKLHGVIWGNVKSNNTAKLEEILRLKLYNREP